MWNVIFCQTRCFGGLTSWLGWVASSSRKQTAWPTWNFCPIVNSWRNASVSGMLGTCASIWRLAATSHPQNPTASPYFFAHTWVILHTLSHTLPLHDSHLNTEFLNTKIQTNLARNKTNKMVELNSTLQILLLTTFNHVSSSSKWTKMIFSKPTNFVYVIYLFILMVCLASLGHLVIIAFFFSWTGNFYSQNTNRITERDQEPQPLSLLLNRWAPYFSLLF